MQFNQSHIIQKYLQIFKTRHFILLTISASCLFLKYSQTFTDFSLEILITCVLITKRVWSPCGVHHLGFIVFLLFVFFSDKIGKQQNLTQDLLILM